MTIIYRKTEECDWCGASGETVVLEGATVDYSLIEVCWDCLPEVCREIDTAKVMKEVDPKSAHYDYDGFYWVTLAL